AVHGHRLAPGDHGDAGVAVAIGELVRALAAVHALELEPRVLALGSGRGGAHGERARPPLARDALHAPLEPRELAARQGERDVAQRSGAILGAQLDEHAIERLDVLRGAGGRERRIAIAQDPGELDAGRHASAYREVERLPEGSVLRGTEVHGERL